jgi:hypothetical protein
MQRQGSAVAQFDRHAQHVDSVFQRYRKGGALPLHDLHFRLCFSDAVAGPAAGPPQLLFRSTGHSVVGQAGYSNTAHADGYGRRAIAGHAAIVVAAVLQPTESRAFQMELRGQPASDSAELHPAYLIALREAPGGERLWPASTVSGETASPIRHYYREAALLIPGPYRFSLGGARAEVTSVLPAND